MKTAVFALAIIFLALNAKAQVIYGKDGRLDFFEAAPELKELARSTVALIADKNLELEISTFRFAPNQDIEMCPSEKFLRQPRVAFCSGTLIAPDIVLTAGHCIRDTNDCRATKFVFDYRLNSSGERVTQVAYDLVYGCDGIIWSQALKKGADFALIRLDRPVVGRTPVPLSDKGPEFHQPLMLIGHPAGLPIKITLDGQLRSNIPDSYFIASVDSFSGNSGSAVFDQNTKMILGVLSRGGQDYERKSSCYVSKVCDENGCQGEDVTRISEVKKYLPRN